MCVIMAHCGGEAQHAGSGVHCASGHFVCIDDLEALITDRANNAEEAHCPHPSCETSEYDAAVLASRISTEAFDAWMRGKERRLESEIGEEMNAAMRKQLQAKLAEYTAVDGEVKRHTDVIIEQIVNISCPRCGAVFDNFDGCCALVCSVRRCRAAFCAWCFADCGEDAHDHVRGCEQNPTDREDRMFAPRELWTEAMVNRRKRRTADYLDGIFAVDVRAEVVKRVKTVTDGQYP